MAVQNYDEALRRVLAHEGGYTNDPKDPGGPTNYGITIHDAQAYWKPDATAADVRAMPLSIAQKIYRSKYWDKMDCDDLPSGVDYAVFDFGVNSGISRSAKYLQAIAGLPQDGLVGPQTIKAVRDLSATDIISKLCADRLAFLQSLSTWDHFGKGWGQRVADVKIVALGMAKTQPRQEAQKPVPSQPASNGLFSAVLRAVFSIFNRSKT